MVRKLYALCGADRTRMFSPHVWKAVMALAHKGIDVDIHPVGFTEIPGIEDGVTKIVPLLCDGAHRISDSFAISLYLEEAYADRPSLFGGTGGIAMARFVESWSNATVHTALVRIAILDIHAGLAPVDQAYFRSSREARFGMSLEEVAQSGQRELEGFAAKLEPLRLMLKRQPFIGGESPLFADYIVFGALQWVRLTSQKRILDPGDAVADWFDRCLDLHGGLGRSMTAA